MPALRFWRVSDKFWERVAPLLPERRRAAGKKYRRKPGGGRKALDRRKVFEAIVYVLRTGIQWKALPKERFGSSSSVHAYFKEWERARVFDKIWKKGLVECDELEGIAWEWQSIDGVAVKSLQSQKFTAPSPLGREAKLKRLTAVHRRVWRPVIDRRKRAGQAQFNTNCCHDWAASLIKRYPGTKQKEA